MCARMIDKSYAPREIFAGDTIFKTVSFIEDTSFNSNERRGEEKER
jgi:hypothetical protein